MSLFLLFVSCFASLPHDSSRLLAVLRELGGEAHLDVAASMLGGRGLFCPAGGWPANKTVVAVPSALLFGPEVVARLYPDLPRLRDYLMPEELVAAALARERFRAALRRRPTLWERVRGHREPEWRAWIDVLPQQAVPNAATWTERDAKLANALFYDLPPIRPSRQLWGEWTGVTSAQFRWGLSIVLSRSFAGYLVPFVDFANHPPPDARDPVFIQAVRSVNSFEEAVRWDEIVHWSLTRACVPGEEIYLDYGSRPMLHMEAAFGGRFPGPLSLRNSTCALLRKSATFVHSMSESRRLKSKECGWTST